MKPKTPQKHAEVIKAWADGHQIQWRHTGKDRWINIEDKEIPSWIDLNEYRVKPEREYPKTSLTFKEMRDIYNTSTGTGFESVANAAIKRHEEDKEKISSEKQPAQATALDFSETYDRGFIRGLSRAKYLLKEKCNVDMEGHIMNVINEEIKTFDITHL